MIYRFVVWGIPVAQGSMKAFRTPTGGVVVTSTNSRTLGAWRQAVAAAAAQARVPLCAYPVRVGVTFFFNRPKGHYGRRGLRDSAPAIPSSRPDLDKLTRAILDAITGVAFRDDSQVATIEARKRYAPEGEGPCAVIEISEDTP